MMSNETLEEREQELNELKTQIEQAAEAEKEKAVAVANTPPLPSPEILASSAPEVQTPVENNSVTPQVPEVEKPKDDPMEWAKAKGFKTPEDMARALLQKERAFHESRQKQAQNQQPATPPIPEWRPQPNMGGGYEYQPAPAYIPPQPTSPYSGGDGFRELASLYPQIDPEDLRRFMPVVVDAAQAIARRERVELEKQITSIQRSTERNNELMTLMQDPAFRDNRVQKEIHVVLDADPSIFQRERQPLVEAYRKAMENLARKQILQQGVNLENNSTTGNMPPVTAGGGNGSAVTSPRKITQKEFDSWSVKDQEAFLKSNGAKIPRK